MATEYTRVEGLDGLLARLKAFPVEMAKAGGPIKTALRKGGKLVLDQAKANVRDLVAEENQHGLPPQSTGLLEESIVLQRGKPTGGASEVFKVRLRRKKSAKGVPVTKYGKMLEFGTEKVKAFSWLRNAAALKKDEFYRTVAKELAAGIKRIEKKLGAVKR
jgi:HK97 gp10 family phage protein